MWKRHYGLCGTCQRAHRAKNLAVGSWCTPAHSIVRRHALSRRRRPLRMLRPVSSGAASNQRLRTVNGKIMNTRRFEIVGPAGFTFVMYKRRTIREKMPRGRRTAQEALNVRLCNGVAGSNHSRHATKERRSSCAAVEAGSPAGMPRACTRGGRRKPAERGPCSEQRVLRRRVVTNVDVVLRLSVRDSSCSLSWGR